MAETVTLGQRLRARRVGLGLTLADVAERSGLSLPYVSNLERGRGNPTIDALRSIAEALQTPLGALVGEQEQSEFDPLELVLSDAPDSLMAFSKTKRFAETVERLAKKAGGEPAVMRRRLLISMASAPRRSSGDPSEDDWRRLIDVYSLIITSDE